MFRIEIIGNIGNDAEIKSIKGNDYHSFSIAYTDNRGNENSPIWIRCLKKISDNDKIGKWLKKGTKVYISGMPYTSAYQKQDNSIASDLNVFVNTLELIGGKSKESKSDDLPF